MKQVIQKNVCGLPGGRKSLNGTYQSTVCGETWAWTSSSKGACKGHQQNLYTLLLNGTTTKQVVKQMDFLIRHWSNSKNQVVTRYLDIKFFGRAKAEDFCNKTTDAIQENWLDLKLLLKYMN